MKPQSPSLRIEAEYGLPAREYRIVDGTVQVRVLTPVRGIGETVWQLTPDELSSHVKRNTVIAQWLEHRLGWRNLLRACVGEEVAA